MSKVLRAIAGLGLGWIAGATLGYALIQLLSANSHDKAVEAAMTAAFFTGPLGGILGAIAALTWRR